MNTVYLFSAVSSNIRLRTPWSLICCSRRALVDQDVGTEPLQVGTCEASLELRINYDGKNASNIYFNKNHCTSGNELTPRSDEVVKNTLEIEISER